jgi:DNA repair exonuclease SbcCD ATPase subunit
LAEHQQILDKVEGLADQALDNLAAAWANLQAVLPLAQPDPLAASYHALWPKREAARGIPQLLEDFAVDAGQLTRQVNATLATLQDQLRYVQETLGRLPKVLAEAQQTAEDWRSLQNLAQQLAALRAALENLSQETFAVNTREDVNKRLTEFQQQAEQIARIQEELRFEAHEIGRLDKIIRDHWEAIQDNPMGLSEAKINRAVKMTDTQYERALSAERCQDTRAALEKCLSYVENLALN